MITIDVRESVKLEDGYSCFISFDYNNKILNEIKQLPYRFYNPENTEWEVPINKIDKLVNKLQEFDIEFKGKLSELKPKMFDLPENFKFKTEPFSHQIECLNYGLENTKWFLGDEQGLGKTKQSIDIAVAKKLTCDYKHCLIVCGVNTLKWNWVNEIHTHSNEGPHILGQKITKGKIKIGSTGDKVKDLLRIEELPYFIITNVESFRDEKFAKTVQELCVKKQINMCIADEMHKMKNPTSQQTKGFLKCQPEYRLAMTGTPLMNSPLDLYVILKWLGYEKHAFYSFKQHYCIMGGYGGYEIVGYKNMSQLTEQINDIMLRRLKDEVLDLPEKTYIEEYVEMTPKQSEIYKQVEMDIKANIDMVKFENNPLATLIRLRQATGYTGILSSEIKESSKLDRLCDIVEESISNNHKVIIFSNWTQMTDAIYDRLIKICNCCVITGNTLDVDRQEIVNDFQCISRPIHALIGTIGAMGTGLTLTAATTVIFIDEPWNKALFDQAVDRAHRIGQKNNITIYSIMCKDTIDERIHNIIYKKGVLSDAIIDGKVMSNSREVFNYLLG